MIVAASNSFVEVAAAHFVLVPRARRFGGAARFFPLLGRAAISWRSWRRHGNGRAVVSSIIARPYYLFSSHVPVPRSASRAAALRGQGWRPPHHAASARPARAIERTSEPAKGAAHPANRRNPYVAAIT
jgi:hypothetical protein